MTRREELETASSLLGIPLYELSTALGQSLAHGYPNPRVARLYADVSDAWNELAEVDMKAAITAEPMTNGADWGVECGPALEERPRSFFARLTGRR